MSAPQPYLFDQWLVTHGGTPPVEQFDDHDAVLAAVHTARAELRTCYDDGRLDDGLTALAWFEHHLDHIARMAGAAGAR